jgi:hypothetical protein
MSDDALRQYEHELRRQGRQVRVLPLELVKLIELELTYHLNRSKTIEARDRSRGLLTSMTMHVKRLSALLSTLHEYIPVEERDAVRKRVMARMRELSETCTIAECTPDAPLSRCCGVAALYDLDLDPSTATVTETINDE